MEYARGIMKTVKFKQRRCGVCKRNGTEISYYETGNKSQPNWKDSKRNGIFKSYYESGQLETEGTYKDDYQHGNWKVYHENGH